MYEDGISFGYEQNIIKRGGKTSICDKYLNEFFFPFTIGGGCFSEISSSHLFNFAVGILIFAVL